MFPFFTLPETIDDDVRSNRLAAGAHWSHHRYYWWLLMSLSAVLSVSKKLVMGCCFLMVPMAKSLTLGAAEIVGNPDTSLPSFKVAWSVHWHGRASNIFPCSFITGFSIRKLFMTSGDCNRKIWVIDTVMH